ncbi:MAG: OmpH family outer membrane protein [Succinivibrio sp.]|nr:OmpH family outer membrane protein [Succinivibrio sp.]
MKKVLTALAVSACLFMTACNDQAQSNLIGVVDIERVMKESTPAESARKHLDEVRTTLQEGYKSLEKEWENAPAADRQKALADGLNVLNRQMAAEEAAANQVVHKLMRDEAQAWVDKNKASFVVLKPNLLASSANIDITSDIIAGMNAKPAQFAKLPTVQISPRDEAKNDKAEPAKKN